MNCTKQTRFHFAYPKVRRTSGKCIAGNKEFIAKARKYRKMLGGGLRQAGIIARAGIFALENLVDRLKKTIKMHKD